MQGPPACASYSHHICPLLPSLAPKRTQQYQELQKQTAAHSQCLEVKVKSLQEQLGRAPQHACPTPVGGDGVRSRVGKCILGGVRGDGSHSPCTLSTAAAEGQSLTMFPGSSPTLGDGDCTGDADCTGNAVIPPLSQSPLPYQAPVPMYSESPASVPAPDSHWALGKPAEPGDCHPGASREGQDHHSAAELGDALLSHSPLHNITRTSNSVDLSFNGTPSG